MSKARKIWSIIFMAGGAFYALMSLIQFKNLWPLFILSLIVAGVGILLFVTGKKKAEEAARKQAEEAEAKAKAEAEAKARKEAAEAAAKAKAEAEKAEWIASQKVLAFTPIMLNKYQKQIKKIYDKINNYESDDFYYPSMVISPYLSNDGVTIRFNVMVDDDVKIGEVPEEKYPEIETIRNNSKVDSLDITIDKEMGAEEYFYTAKCCIKYHIK